MTSLSYMVLTDQQFRNTKMQLDSFRYDRSKHKKLYEIQFTAFDLEVFERPSNPTILCVHR